MTVTSTVIGPLPASTTPDKAQISDTVTSTDLIALLLLLAQPIDPHQLVLAAGNSAVLDVLLF